MQSILRHVKQTHNLSLYADSIYSAQETVKL